MRSKIRQGRGEGDVIGEEEGGANNGEGAVKGRVQCGYPQLIEYCQSSQ